MKPSLLSKFITAIQKKMTTVAHLHKFFVKIKDNTL